jgi:hypothetical protein
MRPVMIEPNLPNLKNGLVSKTYSRTNTFMNSSEATFVGTAFVQLEYQVGSISFFGFFSCCDKVLLL